MKNKKSQLAFTMIEVLAALVILSFLSVAVLTAMENVVNDARFSKTLREMEVIRNALVGETQRLETGLRAKYGYLGDVGDLPTTEQGIAALYTNPDDVDTWSLSSTYGIGSGWKGPYLVNTPDVNYARDAWGRDYVYEYSGEAATLTSYGADGVAGGTGFDQDIVLNIPPEVLEGNLFGYVVEGSGDLLGSDQAPYIGDADVYIHYPDGSGGVRFSIVSIKSTDAGKYTFQGIPLGFASVMVYIPNITNPSVTLGPTIIEINKASTAAVPVTQDGSYVFGNTLECPPEEDFTVTFKTKSNGTRTLGMRVTFAENYNWTQFSFEQEQNVEIERIRVTDIAEGTSKVYRFNSATGFIDDVGASNIANPVGTGTTNFTISPAITFSAGVTYQLEFVHSSTSTSWSNAHTIFYYQIGCKFVKGGS